MLFLISLAILVFTSLFEYGSASPMKIMNKKSADTIQYLEQMPNPTFRNFSIIDEFIEAVGEGLIEPSTLQSAYSNDMRMGSVNCFGLNLEGGCVDGYVPKNTCVFVGGGSKIMSVKPFDGVICIYFAKQVCRHPKKGEAFFLKGPGAVPDVSKYIGDRTIEQMICTTEN